MKNKKLLITAIILLAVLAIGVGAQKAGFISLGSGSVTVEPGTVGVPVVGGTVGSVLFVDGSGDLGEDNTNFFWDDTNNRLTVASVLANGGTLTLGGTGGSNNENLTFDFETSANTVIWNTTTGASQLRFVDGFQISLGSGSDFSMRQSTTGSNDHIQFGIGVGAQGQSGYLSLLERADEGSVNRAPLVTSLNPKFRIYSADAGQALDYIEFSHNQTDAVIEWGNGSLLLGSASATTTFSSTGALTLEGLLTTVGITDTGVLNFGGATSLEIPNTTAPTVNAIGELALDTTSGNLILATSTNSTSVVFGGATTTLYAFSIASTSPELVSGGALEFPSHFQTQVVTAIICSVDGGTSVIINLSDTGTNDTNAVTCTTSVQQFALTSNIHFTEYEDIRAEIGTVTGVVDYLIVRVVGYRQTN